MPAPRPLAALCALALLALPAPARAAELVVSLAPGATRADAAGLAGDAGGRIVDALPQLGAYLLDVPERAGAISARGLVRSVESNGYLRLAGIVDDPLLPLS